MWLALFLGLGSTLLHPDSISSSRVEIEGPRARALVRCQVASLQEVVPGLDGDGDGAVAAEEVAAQAEALGGYVAEHYRVRTGTDRRLQGGRVLAPRFAGARLTPADPDVPERLRGKSIDVELQFEDAQPLCDLQLEVSLFQTTSPGHVDLCTVLWPDGTSHSFVLTQEEPVGRSDPTGRGAFQAYFALGWHHILSGWDHLAFLLALVLASRGLGALLWLVSAFTVAHSLTLGLAALRIVNLGRYSGTVEALIALSIAYVALETALQPDAKRTRWLEALGFGLIHGLGFAGFLMESLVSERSKAWGLLSFNLGVEAGQIGVVVAVVLVFKLLLPSRDGFLAPRRARRWGSMLVGFLGLYWFAERILG
jgi:hypothetical protein